MSMPTNSYTATVYDFNELGLTTPGFVSGYVGQTFTIDPVSGGGGIGIPTTNTTPSETISWTDDDTVMEDSTATDPSQTLPGQSYDSNEIITSFSGGSFPVGKDFVSLSTITFQGSDGSTVLGHPVAVHNSSNETDLSALDGVGNVYDNYFILFETPPNPNVEYTATAATIDGNFDQTPFFTGVVDTTTPDGTVHGNDNGEVMDDGYDDTLNNANGDIIGNGDGEHDDIILGAGGDDTISSGQGVDEVYGGTGNDAIYGGSGEDEVFGDAGNDFLKGEDANDTVSGGVGDDQVYGGAGDDSLEGGVGDDTLGADASSTVGPNLLVNGSFEDGTHSANGVNGLTAWSNWTGSPDAADDGTSAESWNTSNAASDGTGYITMWSGNTGASEGIQQTLGAPLQAGTTYTVNFNAISSQQLNGQWFTPSDIPVSFQIVDITTGTVLGDVTVQGTNYTEYSVDITPTTDVTQIGFRPLTQGVGNNPSVILDELFLGEAGAGSDACIETGNDTMNAGSGDDVVFGASGEDVITGGAGNDSVYGGDGNDVINAGSGDDNISGGTGSDTVSVTEASNDIIDGGEDGADDQVADGDVDVLDVTAASGDASVQFAPTGGAAQDSEDGTIFFANGDTLAFTNFENVIAEATITPTSPDGTVHGNDNAEVMGDGYDDTLNSANGDIIGDGDGNHDDIILGAGGNDTIQAGSGDDIIFGGTGGDDIFGEAGNDLSYGGSGDDDIRDNAGDATAYGGEGNDGIRLTGDYALIYGGQGDDFGSGSDGNDDIYGGSGDDTLNGNITSGDVNDGSDTIFGGTGNDIVQGNGGNDIVYGGDDDDTVVGGDTKTGSGLGDDSLYGGEGNDVILGGSGDDLIDAGSGDDTVYGGIGNDTVVVTEASYDTIDGGEDGPDDQVADGDVDVLDVTAASGDASVQFAPTGGAAQDSEDGTIFFANGDTLAFTNFEDVIAEATIDGKGPDATVHGSENDDIITDGYNDAVNNGNGDVVGDDTIDGVGGTFNENDIILAYGGDDMVVSGDGADTVDGGTGNDTVDAQSGDDSVMAGDGDDLVCGRSGDDIIIGDASNVASGSSSSTSSQQELTAWSGPLTDISEASPIEPTTTLTQSISSEALQQQSSAAADTVTYDDTLKGEQGNDTILGDYGNDLIYGGSGDDSLIGGDRAVGIDRPIDGADTIYGGIGNDVILGDADNDVLYGGTDTDTLKGGVGDDYINTGSGDDLASGGFGSDTFDIDTFDSDTIVGNEDSDNSDIDVLDLSDLNGQYTINYAGGDDEDGSVIMEDSLGNPTGDVLQFQDIEQIICFARGTQISTNRGEVAIEDLEIGDMVNTMDNGLQPIRWIGKRTVPATGKLAPIVFKAGALGNTRDLRVSPQHRMLVNDWRAETLFGEFEVLSAAKHFVNGDTIYVDEGGEVEYFHILFDTHEIVFAEGAASESFHPGEEGAEAVDPEQFEELMTLFPELRDNLNAYGPSARMTLKAHEGRMLAMEVTGS